MALSTCAPIDTVVLMSGRCCKVFLGREQHHAPKGGRQCIWCFRLLHYLGLVPFDEKLIGHRSGDDCACCRRAVQTSEEIRLRCSNSHKYPIPVSAVQS